MRPVPKSDIDELYMRDPYYIVPDGEVGQQAFAVRSHKPGTTARVARVTASERSGRL